MPTLPRVLGTLTAAYGAATLARPRLLAEPCGLADENGDLSDAAVFGLLLPDRQARGKAAAVAGAWGVLGACSVLAGKSHDG